MNLQKNAFRNFQKIPHRVNRKIMPILKKLKNKAHSYIKRKAKLNRYEHY